MINAALMIVSDTRRGVNVFNTHGTPFQPSKALAAKYPQDIIDLYWKEVKYYINLGKEKNYLHAVIVLREIRQIMKKNRWTEDWNNYYAKFLEENHRKKLLIKELEKF